MTSPGRAKPFVLGVLLAGASGLAGFAIARTERDPSPGSNASEAVLAEVRALAQQIARLETRLAHAASAVPPLPRESAASAAEARPRGEPIDEDRLLRRVIDALAEFPRGDDGALRQARLQNAMPNAAAITDLHARLLAAEAVSEEALRAQQREWWLLGPADVVRRLGMPDDIIQTKVGSHWLYNLPDNRRLNVHFQNGLVAQIEN